MPLVERIVKFYQDMPEDRRSITPKLLDFESHAAKDTNDPAKRLEPHADKCVFYGIYVTCVNILHQKFGFSSWHLLAVLTNTVVSESPDFFVDATDYFMSCRSRVKR
jgi:hypothetical protein